MCRTNSQQAKNKKSWDSSTINGYYIGTSKEYYQCYNVWATNTWSQHKADMLTLKHKYITVLQVTAADALINAAQHLISTLQTTVTDNISPMQLQQLMQLAMMFKLAAGNITTRQSEKMIHVLQEKCGTRQL